MPCNSLRQNASCTEALEIFHKLKDSLDYRKGFDKNKLRIIRRLVAQKNTLQTFARASDRYPYEINGFMVESCARFSRQLPRNTPRANEFSQTIIEYLKKEKLCNPDYLWLNIRGKRITITGIGEVKSHTNNIAHKPSQVFFQQENICRLMQCNILQSLLPSSHRLVLAENFMRYLILPRSSGMLYLLPPSIPLGWEVREIEFTLQEILFLKQLFIDEALESEKTPHFTAFPEESYQMLTRDVIERTEKIMITFFGHLPFIRAKKNLNALVAWGLLWESVPINQHSISRVLQWAHNAHYDSKNVLNLLTSPPASLVRLYKKEKTSCDLLTTRTSCDNMFLAHALLSRIREIKRDLPCPPILSKKKNIDLFAIL